MGHSSNYYSFSAWSEQAQTLPPHAQLNIGALAGLFSSRSTSYKYLFFLSLLDTIVQADGPATVASASAPSRAASLALAEPTQSYTIHSRSDRPAISFAEGAAEGKNNQNNSSQLLTISLKTVIVNLLQFGWYPHRFFRLSYGRTDQIGQALDELDFTIAEQAITHPQTQQNLRTAIKEQFGRIRAQRFSRFVPYRLLTPFFAQSLRGQPDHRKNDLIVQLAQQSFATANAPFYCFNDSRDALMIHPHWQAYFKQHYAIVRGWALLQWARYLQNHNPSVPAILFKLEPPMQRASLEPQRRYWRSILTQTPLRCIYSHAPIDPSGFDLDHFLPWSFVCHDQLWNLIPTTPEANRSKGRHLPKQNEVQAFIYHQHQGLAVYQQLYGNQRRWQNVANEYIEGLAIAEPDLLDKQKLTRAYQHKFNPLFSLAKNMGY